jgi:hypothetical protein
VEFVWFVGILQNPVIATNVNATMYVHRGLRLRTDEDDEVSKPSEESAPKKSNFVVDRISRDIGNVTKETEVWIPPARFTRQANT